MSKLEFSLALANVLASTIGNIEQYILTVMDRKVKGIVDPLLYTDNKMESVEVP